MPPPVYSQVFYKVSGFTGFEEIFVPIGKVWIITDIDVYGRVRSGDKVYFADLVTTGAFWYVQGTGVTGSSQTEQWQGRHVIRPHGIEFVDGFSVKAESGALWDIYVSGYELTLV